MMKMPAYKNKDAGTWYVVTQYTDWTGERKQKCKRGFSTRREALEWEQKFQQQSAGDLDMNFEAFIEIYTADLKVRLKESTWQTKENIIKTKILPYFGKRKINEITTKDVIAWQNELLAYRDEQHLPYSPSYLKTLHNQLSAIFNIIQFDVEGRRVLNPRLHFCLRSPVQSVYCVTTYQVPVSLFL